MQERTRQITFRFLAEPTDVNFGGKVHGGAVMKWIDQAAYACAAGWCGMYCVTAYVGGIRFYQPIIVGDVVELNARVIYTGRTSMHIALDVHARPAREQSSRHTTHCVIVFVAMGADGTPAVVPSWQPVEPADIEAAEYARKLMDIRQRVEQEMGMTAA
jgi:acyl-CoA hydrolase